MLCKILQKIPSGLWENGRHTHTNSIYNVWKTYEPNKNDWQCYTCYMIKKYVNTINIAFLPWKRPWSSLVEGHIIRVTACELLQSGSRKLIWNSQKSCGTRWGWCCSWQYGELRWRPDVWGKGWVFCVFLHCLVEQGADFCVHQMLFMGAITREQMQHYAQNIPGYTNGIGTNLCFQSKCYNGTDCT